MIKRGQVTIFIIIAIILVVSIVGFFLFRQQLESRGVLTPQDEGVYLFVENCIEEIGKDAIYYIAENGGYFLPPEFSTSQGIPYYYSNGKNYMPSKKDIEKEISYYMNNLLPSCTQDFIDSSESSIIQGKIETETIIKEKEIIFNVKYPLSIRKDESTTLFEDFKDVKISVRLGIIYNVIEEIIQEQLTNEYICLTCISNIVLENDLTIDMVSIEEAIIFSVIDEYSKIRDVPLKFMFANKYEVE